MAVWRFKSSQRRTPRVYRHISRCRLTLRLLSLRFVAAYRHNATQISMPVCYQHNDAEKIGRRLASAAARRQTEGNNRAVIVGEDEDKSE
jgi:hypothetical protein